MAVNYLLTNPPKKQVWKNNMLEFSDTSPDRNLSQAEQVLVLVRQVRNNLFHGGKFLPLPAGDNDRDQLLIRYSLTVLRECIPLHRPVDEAYA
jgi:hypothetical protein